MKKSYRGPERREFLRLDYTTPLDYKVCKKKTVSTLLNGYIHDVSQSGLRCRVNQKVKMNDTVWLSFDRSTLHICEDLEKNALIYQRGVVGRVVWVRPRTKKIYEVGVQFLTRAEKNLSNIYPKMHFIEKGEVLPVEDDTENEAEVRIDDPPQEGLFPEE